MTIFIDKTYAYALIGASQNHEKYGYKVFADLKKADYNVHPINPKGGTILGSTVYKSIDAIPQEIDVVIFVVPSEITISLLPIVHKKGIKKVWFQPGSESDVAINFCKENNIHYIAHACMMMERPQ